MTTVTTGSFKVYTYKAGLLSRLAHDLRLTLTRFEITFGDEAEGLPDAEAAQVRGRFWPASLVVDGAVKKGSVDRSTPSASDKKKIYGNIKDKILHTDQFPEITFEGKIDRGQVRGQLTMHGRTQPVVVQLLRGETYRGSVELRPTRWGIPPFKAVGGAIKLQDRVRIEFDLA